MKKFLIILIAAVVIGYLIFSASYFRNRSKDVVCESFSVVIEDSTHYRFVSTQDIVGLVKRYDLYPVGKTFGEINTLAIRDSILTNKLVESAKVFITPKGSVMATISQRKPILRVISDVKGNFYVDNERRIMPVSANFAVYVPVATGVIDEEFAQNQLSDFALFLSSHPDWDAWIEQIVVQKDQEVELIPRAGDFRIILGSLDDYQAKLAKFSRFVDEGLNVVGWNRYSAINLKYDNQVVCTKK
ncbi:hypothetical protein [Proteiniphilum sp.]|uniref:cell division protein FtsQ/DivIB n=1 Tax=Proteiniphilum sp. TaxID=1926877 RepID=UPI002B212821|nr:hypothetical protein [Proteiniphilum sp.]MEA4916521.1 hypothetical protein [Proteiniphilum sp.]